MTTYIIRRILIFIPTLIVISLFGFVISINAPGDPVERLVNAPGIGGSISGQTKSSKELKQSVREKLGLNLPVFYFNFVTLAEPDTLYKIPDKGHRQMLDKLVHKNGNWERVVAYYLELKHALKTQADLPLDSVAYKHYPQSKVDDALNTSRFTLLSLLEETNDQRITEQFEKLRKLYARYGFFDPMQQVLKDIVNSYRKLISNPQRWKTYIPAFNWYGFDNQYHNWISGILVEFDFGRSYRDQQPVTDRIEDRFIWSFLLAILSVFIAYLISIPIGIYAAYKRNSFFDRASGVILFALLSLPNFFIGTFLLFLFANPDMLVWFPEAGIQDPSVYQENWSLWRKIQHHAPYMVLPLITYTYSSFAFLSRQMRVGLLDVINQDFIKTARAKGLSERKVVLKHALRNGLLPIITLFSNIFPMALGGSVIVERIFSIPGMGWEIYQAILSADYPMIVAIFTLTGFLTVIGFLVADILYAFADPRISYR